MKPTVTRDANHIFKAPENWVPEIDGPCGDLQVRVETFGRDIVEIFSTWAPNEEERALIAQGYVIETGLCSHNQPVMQVRVVAPMDPALIKYLSPQPTEPSAKSAITINEDAHGQ